MNAQNIGGALRILMVSEDVPQPSMGGLGQHAINLAKGLARAGHQVDFMGSRRFPYDEETRARLALPGQFFHDLGWVGGWKESRLGFFNPIRRSVLARSYARTILRRAQCYDVIHYHGHVPDVGAFIPVGINFVQSRHDQGSDCVIHVRFKQGAICCEVDPGKCAGCITARPNKLQTALSALAVAQYRRRVQLSFRQHKTVFVSEMLRRNFTRSAGPGPWGDVVHNFLDTTRLDRAVAGRWRPEVIPPTARLILYAGKLYPPKGIEPFLATMVPHLPAEQHIVVIGDGPQEHSLRATYGRPNVHFLGWREGGETLALMADAEAVVVPSLWEEPCATTVLEGLALGKPLYALARGGTPELRTYEMFPGQLRLFDKMEDLVSGLILAVPYDIHGVLGKFGRSVEEVVSEVINIYLAESPAGIPPAMLIKNNYS